MGGDLRADKESDVLVEEPEGEDTSKLRILLPQHDDWATQEPEESSDEGRPSLDQWGEAFLGSGHDEGGDEFGCQEGGQQQETHIQEFVGAGGVSHDLLGLHIQLWKQMPNPSSTTLLQLRI